MEIFMERLDPPTRLILFGAGHVAEPTARLARSVGFSVTVVDDREEWNNDARFPECHRLLRAPDDSIDAIDPGPEDWLVIMTHEHRLDETVLEQLLSRPHRYIGLMGSRRKVLQVLQRIAARGDVPDLERLYAPIGTPIGAIEPAEIAVSIVSELLALRHGVEVEHLTLTRSPALEAVLEGRLSPTDAAAKAMEEA
jgi:xanthine dehydrogenase accessory factor